LFHEVYVDTIYRIPNVRVKITRPNWGNDTKLEEFVIVTFESRLYTMEEKSKAAEIRETPQGDYDARSDGMLPYSYAESLQSLDSPFSLSLTPEQDLNGLTWFDKIAAFDLVYIEEWGKVRYCGLVHRVRYSARMGEGPEHTIMVEGNEFGELLKIFQLVLDVKLFIGLPEEMENIKSKSEFITLGGKSLKDAILFYYNNFKKIVGDRNNKQSVLELLIEDNIDLEVDENCVSFLPISQNMYQAGSNTLWDIIRKIVPDPLCELFGYWNTDRQKYIIVARQCPFTGEDWNALEPVYKINPVTLKEYHVGYDDSDASTVFYGIAPSFGYTNNVSLTVDEIRESTTVDEEKWKKYGYRPLFAELSFLKRDDVDKNDVKKALSKIGELLHSWYSNNDQFLNGVISVISYEDDKTKYPVIGRRLEFLGGEFYIDEIKRKWAYGASPASEIRVSRGGIYRQNGEYSGPIPKLGRIMNEFEHTVRVENG
jgi:hypothetical protein